MAARKPTKPPAKRTAPATRPAPRRAAKTEWTFAPLTREHWTEFASLFGEKGACAGCWCMWVRLPAKEYREKGPVGRRTAIRRLAGSQAAPGLIAFDGDLPVGWIAVGPRDSFRRLETSRVLAPVDERDVWSVPCFYIAPSHRGRGLTRALLEMACTWAAAKGATCVEGYPVDTRGQKHAAAFLWHGAAVAFEAAGFREVLRRSPTRPIMRRTLRAPRAGRARG